MTEEGRMEDPVWYGEVECTDGATIRRIYDFDERTYAAECERQHEIEEELITEAYDKHTGCKSYSVSVIERQLAEEYL